jgi:nitroimidazol reductase NimA-like FMN-containing flavoprotein (pyridoxamine 5'-phosphate oxidase superfamily)
VARIVAERMTDFNALSAAIATERGLLMSRRHEIQFTPDEQAAFLSQPHKAALATIDKEGFPHVVAMGYRYKDGVIYMTSYGKAQKVVNAQRNPKVSVMVEVGERYADFRGIMIRGYCEIIEDPQVVKETMRLAGESATAAAVPPGASASVPKRVVLKITPYKISSWDHTKLGGKY